MLDELEQVFQYIREKKKFYFKEFFSRYKSHKTLTKLAVEIHLGQ